MSLHQTDSRVHAAVEAELAFLTLRQAVVAENLLRAALEALPDLDPFDGCDTDICALGPPHGRAESWSCDEDFEDYLREIAVDDEDRPPTDEDIQAMLDLEERYEYEERFHCNARFV